ncbi:chemotaxis protein CheA [Rhodobacter ferrooxidans]|uniref:Chemotaxis protein CheA n=1 Tax=Rhodobacter ferrooxidans TaxID=371731 RepID=C8S4H5_9RHOB|nr:chemotaxis protein CheA [Rhodobacter sp. SW2]EEW24142.1 CheA signal transduction histidine kinase [Rhodobacter sp. SW2]
MSDMDEVGGLFRQEAAELIASLEAGLLDLERAPTDVAVINAVFRDLHTIKGSGAMFGYADLAHFVHEFESVFDGLRKGNASVGPDLIAVALRACDQIGQLIDAPQTAGGQSDVLLAALRQAMDGDAADSVSPDQGWRLRFRLGRGTLKLGGNPRLLLEELGALAPIEVRALLDEVPSLDALDPHDCLIGWEVVLSGPVSREAIEDVFFFHRDDMLFELEPLDGPSADAATGPARPEQEKAPDAPQAAAAAGADTMRVETGRLDELMDRVGELVIAEARLSALAQRLHDPGLLAVAEDIQRLASGMRDATMSIRMVPIGSIMGRFRRLMRDLSQSLDKPLAFVTSGEDTELDKTVIELLADPLVHILRNSMDHGLETLAERRAAGKPDTGTIALGAVYSGAEVLITIRDDGRGLDAEKIRAHAVSKGLIAADAQVPRADLLKMIFAPGFSTAAAVTELSGRGVGMDVVKRTVDALRGQIELESEPGHGTTVTLRLPLTLAIIDGLLIEVGGENYAFPLAAVEECVELPPEFEEEGKSSSFLNIRGALVPFLRLRNLFDVAAPLTDFQKVVIVSSSGERVGLVVDRIVGNNQTVIKQLSRLHAQMLCFSGATILGDGSVALILDVPQLVAMGRAQEERARNPRLERAA